MSKLVQGSVDIFPELIALVRDFDLDVTEDGFADNNEYFEDLLKPEGSGERDATRASIKSIFTKRKLISMEAPTKSEKQFLNTWNGDGADSEATPGLPPAGDFVDSFVESAKDILAATLSQPKKLGANVLDGDMFADLAQEIVENINDKPVDLHSALHSIFNGVCRRAAMNARETVTVDIAEIKEKLPLHLDELQPLLNAVQAKAHIAYNAKANDSGVPADDECREEHLGELNEVLEYQSQFVLKENEKVILETIQEKVSEFEDRLRTSVDAFVEGCADNLTDYYDMHDEEEKKLAEEFGMAIKIAPTEMFDKAMDKFIAMSKDLRKRNIEKARLRQLAEAEKKQKMMLAGAGMLIIVAIGIDGDPFDELWACLRILWFLPIIAVGVGIYVAMYQQMPPYAGEAVSVAMQYGNMAKQAIQAKPKKEKTKEE